MSIFFCGWNAFGYGSIWCFDARSTDGGSDHVDHRENALDYCPGLYMYMYTYFACYLILCDLLCSASDQKGLSEAVNQK